VSSSGGGGSGGGGVGAVVLRSGGGTSRRFSTPLIGRVRAISRDHGEPHVCTLAPISLYMVLRDGGPPTLVWLDAPDQGTGSRPDSTIGPSRMRSTLIRASGWLVW